MFLLDTCTLLWLASNQDKLSRSARRAISTHRAQLYVSVVSGFEIAQKVAKGKLVLPRSPAEWMDVVLNQYDLRSLVLEMTSAVAAGVLPSLHADPFDRLLVASAQTHHLTLLTPDPLVRQYPQLATLW